MTSPNPCRHWVGAESRYCGGGNTQLHLSGYRCPEHTPVFAGHHLDLWRQRIGRADRPEALDAVCGDAMRAYRGLPDDLVEARSTRYAEIAAADALSQQIYAAHPGARPGIAAGHINMDPHTNTVIERDMVRMMLDDCISQATSEKTLTHIRQAAETGGYWNGLLEEFASERLTELDDDGWPRPAHAATHAQRGAL